MTEIKRFPEKEREYEATIDVVMPGQSKTTAYKINVVALDPSDAVAKAIETWIIRTEPKDIRVKEITKDAKVITA